MNIRIEGLVAELVSRPRPVLCLDTCDLLDTVRGLTNGDLSHSRSFLRVLDALDLDMNRLQVVITYLVKHEWGQNFARVREQVLSDVRRIISGVESIIEARSYVGLAPLDLQDFDTSSLVDKLVSLSQRLIDRASVLDLDRTSVDRALERVMDKKRPSHENQIKDSIHLEHYLELARQLRSSRFTEFCVFVSSNKSDYWMKREKSYIQVIHPDLELDLNDAGLAFFARLEAAVRHLGI